MNDRFMFLLGQWKLHYKKINIYDDLQKGDNTYINYGTPCYDLRLMSMTSHQNPNTIIHAILCEDVDGSTVYVICTDCYGRPPSGCRTCGKGEY